MGKKILFIMMDLDSASGICVQNVARELASRGHEIHILTKSPKKDPKPYVTEYNGKVTSVPAGFLERVRAGYKSVEGAFGKSVYRLAVMAERAKVVLCYHTWPLKDYGLSRRLTKEALKLAWEECIDMVIPSYNTVDALIAADAVKRENPRIQYIPYMLDAFYGGQTPRLMSEKQKRKKAFAWENRLFSRADGIVMMKPAQEVYRQDGLQPAYLEKTVFLDLPMLNVGKLPVTNRKKEKETVFLFAGSMPRNIRDPQHLLDLFRSVPEPDWRLVFVGPSDFDSVIDAASASDPRIQRIGPVSHQQAVAHMASADYLVNIGNNLAYMVPSKIFEYMSFGKPVISTVKIPNDPCLPYLKQYGNALALEEWASVSENGNKLRHFVHNAPPSPNTSVSALTEPGAPLYANTPAAFADFIQSFAE